MTKVTMDKVNFPNLIPTRIIVKLEASPRPPNASREHQSVQQTPQYVSLHTLTEVTVSMFLRLIFKKGIHITTLPSLSSTPPRQHHLSAYIHYHASAVETPLPHATETHRRRHGRGTILHYRTIRIHWPMVMHTSNIDAPKEKRRRRPPSFNP
jgi:hypothetical protein